MTERDIQPGISSRKGRKIAIDRDLCRRRHWTNNTFAHIKDGRRIATRHTTDAHPLALCLRAGGNRRLSGMRLEPRIADAKAVRTRQNRDDAQSA